MKICVVIPAYNEEKSIASLVYKIRRQNLEVLVVDDGSHDNTRLVASENGATVLRNERNQGKGVSLRMAFDFCLGKDFDAVITMDGDGQHLTEDIPFFLRLAQYSDSGFLIGNRMPNTENMPKLRILTNRLMSWFVSMVAKQKIPDTQCGFRLIKRDVLKKIDLRTSKYEIDSELLIKAARRGVKIESVPIKSVYGGERSEIHPVVDTLRFFRFVFNEVLASRKRRGF
ncbi:glycosyltransferase family 2 protein [Candidatus Omnitrophota bacterium]